MNKNRYKDERFIASYKYKKFVILHSFMKKILSTALEAADAIVENGSIRSRYVEEFIRFCKIPTPSEDVIESITDYFRMYFKFYDKHGVKIIIPGKQQGGGTQNITGVKNDRY